MMKTRLLKSLSRNLLLLLILAGGLQTVVSAQSVNAYENRIVGVWDAQVTIFNCNTGVPLASFPGLHKYELGGTAQPISGANPALLSAHAGIWHHVGGNHYKLAFKMFRFDAAGNNIGWQIVRFDVAINDDATQEAASGQAEVFDSNGNKVGMSCPTFTGTRFQ